MRLLALDFGSKTVGVAVSDALGLTATGVEIIRRKSPGKLRQTLARIEELVKEYQVDRIILGYPVMLDGSEGERVEKTKESVVGLKSAAGFIRRTISGRLHLRKTPEFHFVADDSIAYSANINRILEEENRAHPEWASHDALDSEDDDLF